MGYIPVETDLLRAVGVCEKDILDVWGIHLMIMIEHKDLESICFSSWRIFHKINAPVVMRNHGDIN